MAKNLLDSIFNTHHHLSEDDLDAYIGKKAPPDLQHKVEKAMLNSPLYSDAVDGYEEMGISNLPAFESFSEFKKKLPLNEEAKVLGLLPRIQMIRAAIAVAAIFSLVIAGYFLSDQQNVSPQELFADYYTHYENDISLARRGDTENMHPDFKNALGNYALKNYEAAIADFDQALQAEPDNDAAHYFSGLAYLETNKLDEAISHLTIVKNSSGMKGYGQKAYWYSILATIKKGEVVEAQGMLEKYLDEAGYNIERAKNLREDL